MVKPNDPPHWRLIFAVWESIRDDDWTPAIKLMLLMALLLACLTHRHGDVSQANRCARLPPGTQARQTGVSGAAGVPRPHEVSMVNAAIYLRRPLLATGWPRTGKSSLANLIACELVLGPVLRWSVTSRTALKDALYAYDAIGRMQEINAQQSAEPGIGQLMHLGPLTVLLAYERPRVLLFDELDKSDIDLPNDLLNVFEEGEYENQQLAWLAARHPKVTVLTGDRDSSSVVRRGRIQCHALPIVAITSNGEREFPWPFLRRCLKVHVEPPTFVPLGAMVVTQRRPAGDEAGESGAYQADEDWQELLMAIWHPLTSVSEAG